MTQAVFDPRIAGMGRAAEPTRPAHRRDAAGAGESFGRLLMERISGLKFSAHAEMRLAKRGIELSGDELNRLGEAARRASAKGAKESLVLVGEKAFVVSIANRTVITAMAGEKVREGVFTQIDSAVIA